MDKSNINLLDLKQQYNLQHLPFIEDTWGHRFRTDQTPMLLFFELMCIIESQNQAKKNGDIEKIFLPENDRLYFKHKRNINLRVLLYQNEELESIYKSSMNEEAKWDKQIEYLNRLDKKFFSFKNKDINHFKQKFETFESFYKAIKSIRSLTFDPLTNKRWTSKFIFPISREYIWSDLDNENDSEDRRFFSRGGELIYLMLCRSKEETRDKLEELFVEWLEDKDDSYSNLARLLVIKEECAPVLGEKKLGYLPYRTMKCFQTLSEDIVGILRLSLEKLDKIKILSDMIGFHTGNYILTVGEMYYREQIDIVEQSPHYVAEVLSKTNSSVRKASARSIRTQHNRLETTLSNTIETYFKKNEVDPQEKLDETSGAEEYLKNHIKGYPNVCFKAIGFVSVKNTNKLRYVLTEDFLHSLVISLLGEEKRLELEKFIQELQERYSIFIDQAPSDNDSILQEDLNRNKKNLIELLYQMGMLRHLSDACSYVVDPYLEDTL